MVMMLEFFYDKGNYLRWQSYFFTACLRGNLRIATLLVEKGADVNLSDDEHHTPLHLCSQVIILYFLREL